MCRYQEWNRETHAMGYCEQPVVSNGLCQEHLEWVEDCSSLEGIERTYPYRCPARRAPKLGKPNVKHTVIPPSARRLEFMAWKSAAPKARRKYLFAQWELDEVKREKEASEPSPYTAHGMAEIQRKKAEATEKAYQDKADAERKAQEARIYAEVERTTTRATEPNAATVCGFRFEYRAANGSGFYWNGRRVASTREGLERMGPAMLAKICHV